MTVTLAPSLAPELVRTAPPVLRMELLGLLLASAVVVSGVLLTQEARLERAVTAPAPSAEVLRTTGEFRTEIAASILLVFAGIYGLHVLRRARGHGGDGLLLPSVLTLCGIGLMTMVYFP